MAYQTGSFTNSHELVNIIYGFLLGNGWRHVAYLQSDAAEPDGYDHVFHSTGDRDNTDIFIRVAAGLGDRVSNGLIQHPYDDGYTEYVNTFAYQHFPDNGTAEEDGYNQLGRYGPVLYNFMDQDGTFFEHNLFTSGLGPKVVRVLKERDTGFDTVQAGGLCTFDGKSKVYQSETNSDRRVLNLVDNTLDAIANGSFAAGERSMIGRRRDGSPYLINLNQATQLGDRANIYDIDTGTASLDSGPSTFTSQFTYGFAVQGPRRKRFVNGQPGHQFGYQAQGNGITRWVYFNFEEQHWAETDISPVLPYTFGVSSRPGYGLYVMKEKSGYDTDRIYIFRGGNSQDDFSSIAVGDDGYVTGSWTNHAVTPVNHVSGHRAFQHGKYIVWHNDDGALYRWELPDNPTDSGTWEQVSMESYFLPDATDHGTGVTQPGGVYDVHDHLCSRVHVNEFETNTYWLFASDKHLVVVVKDADGNYNYTYTGGFDPYVAVTSTRITSEALVGSGTITVDDPSIFDVGGRYMIFETKGKFGEWVESDLTGDRRLFAPSEFFTVISKDGQRLQITRLKYSYSVGAVVGEDPVPVMVRVHSMERAQTLNNINLYRDDNFKDPAWQTYEITGTVDSNFRTAAFEEERDDKNFLFPMVLRSGYEGFTGTNAGGSILLVAPPNERPMVGNELRGQLTDVYEAASSITSETVIAIGSKNYIAFSIEESDVLRTVVIGPIN